MRDRRASLDRDPRGRQVGVGSAGARAGPEASGGAASLIRIARMIARLVSVALGLCAMLAAAPAAPAHASLVGSEPADRAVVAQAPPAIKLRFNEPVSPVALLLVDPEGR